MRSIIVSTFVIVTAVMILVSCGSDTSHDCGEGYQWDDNLGMCVKDDNGNTEDDPVTEQDVTDDSDPDSDEISDEDTEGEPVDDETYTGDCIFASAGGTLTLDITEHTLTIGEVTVNGEQPDASLSGLLWARNESSFSDFKVMNISTDMQGSTVSIPDGTYTFYYRLNENDQKVPVVEDMAVRSDTTLDLDLPLYTWSGSVLKNGSAFPSVDANKQADTKLIVASGSYKHEIPYSDFGGFSLLLPEEDYSVSFSGQLSPGGQIVTATVLTNDESVELSEDISRDIDIPIQTMSGSISIAGAAVSSGALVITETPPLSDISAVLADSVTDGNYSAEVIGGSGTSYFVLYVPSVENYPSKYLTVAQWTDITDLDTTTITLDLARLHGTLQFRGGSFTALSGCEHTDPLCTVGKLKLRSFSGQSILVNDLGPDPQDTSYDILAVRRQYLGDDNEGDPQYSEKQYTMIFESYLNDSAGIVETGQPFTMELEHMNQSGTALVKLITFTDTESNWLTEREINFDVAATSVSGTITHNGEAVESDKNEFVYLKTEDSTVPVVNLSELGDSGAFTFFAPENTYDILYEGSAVLGTEQRAIITRNFEIDSDADISDTAIDIKSFVLSLGLTVNDNTFRSFMDSIGDTAVSFAVEPETYNDRYTLPWIDKSADPPTVRFIGSNPWTLSMDLTTESGDAASTYSFVVAEKSTMNGLSADYTLTNSQNPLTIVSLSAALTVNGATLSGASSSRGTLKLSKAMDADIQYPAGGDSTAALFVIPSEYDSPKFTTGSGFDTQQSIFTDCIYIAE